KKTRKIRSGVQTRAAPCGAARLMRISHTGVELPQKSSANDDYTKQGGAKCGALFGESLARTSRINRAMADTARGTQGKHFGDVAHREGIKHIPESAVRCSSNPWGNVHYTITEKHP